MHLLTRHLTAALLLFAATGAEAVVPVPDHVVVAIMENTNYGSIVGSAAAPYINSLIADGALMTDAHGVTHPSQPNYLVLFSGSNQGTTTDACPIGPFATDNLGSLLIAGSLTFTGYSESLPAPGDSSCTDGVFYRRKHNPWVNFSNVPSASNQPFSVFPADYSTLPTVSFVVPNQYNDMHDGPTAAGDAWLQANIDDYVQWAKTHNSVFILTWDEDDFLPINHIVTLLVGEQVVAGSYATRTDHLDVLRTIEDMYGLSYAGASDTARQISEVFATCGDGIEEPGEECGDGALVCDGAQVCVSCQCLNPVACSSGIALDKPSVSLTASPSVFKFKASAVIPKPWVGVDPPTAGIRIVVDTIDHSGGIDATLAAGAAWKANAANTKWTYTDKTAAVSGIRKVTVTDKSSKIDGQLQIAVAGKSASSTLPYLGDVRASVIFGASSECAAVSEGGATLTCSGDAAYVKCK